MSDIAQTANGAIAVANNDVAIVDGADQTRQVLAQRLRTIHGEWFLDKTIGIPYLSDEFQKSRDIAEAFMKREILGTPGVQDLIEFDYQVDPETRVGALTFRVRSDTGEISMEVVA